MSRQYKEIADTQSLLYVGNSGSVKTLDELESIFEYIFPLLKDRVMATKQVQQMGRPMYSPEFLFKIILIKHLYNLSERETEEFLKDRISFRKFVGINYDNDIPERHIIRDFMHQLYDDHIGKSLIETTLVDLSSRGILISKGKIADSTIVQAQGMKTNKEDRRDQDATFFKKNSVTHFGYKNHTLVEKEHKLVTSLEVTKASVHDALPVDTLLKKDTTKTNALYGDKAYEDKINEGLREYNGIKSMIMHKKPKLKEQPLAEVQRNKLLSKTRTRVEHVYGRVKNEFKLIRARFYTLKKNTGFFEFIFGLYNIKVALKLL